MNRISQHLPAYVETDDPRLVVEFETVEELLAISWVAGCAKCCRNPVFCKAPPSWDPETPNRWMLMVDGTDWMTGDTWWWVIGFLLDGESVDLPIWDSKTREELHR